MAGVADPAWWTAADADPSRHRQGSAWRAAGYRLAKPGLRASRFAVEEVALPDGTSGRVMQPAARVDERVDVTTEVWDVLFEALPGRFEWLADPARVKKGIYRMPTEVRIPPREPGDADPPIDFAFGQQGSTPVLPEPSDATAIAPDMRNLVEQLEAAGEADAATIRGFFPDLGANDFAKLLARARRAREPKVRNHGSRTKPRWVAVGSKGDYLIPIARELWFRDSKDPVPPVGPGTGLPEWFTSQVEKTLSDGGLVLNASEDYLSRLRMARSWSCSHDCDRRLTTSRPSGS
jgi:hypothetical protein